MSAAATARLYEVTMTTTETRVRYVHAEDVLHALALAANGESVVTEATPVRTVRARAQIARLADSDER